MKILIIFIIIVLVFFVALFLFWRYLNKNLLFSLKMLIGDEIIEYVEEPVGRIDYRFNRPYYEVKLKVKQEYENEIIEMLNSKYSNLEKITIPQYSKFKFISELKQTKIIYEFYGCKSGTHFRHKEIRIYVTRDSDGYMYLYIKADLLLNFPL